MDITIRHKQNTAVISTRGAELKSLKIGGRELIWQTDTKYWDKSSPLLFPAVGNVKNNVSAVGSVSFEMPKHGIMRSREFVAKPRTSNALFYCSYRPSDGQYPYPCTVGLSYNLTDTALEISYSVQNNGEQTMWYCIGAHPAIACEDLDKCSIKFDKRETAFTPVKNAEGLFQDENRVQRLNRTSVLDLNYSMFDNDVIYFDKLVSRKVTFREKNHTLAVMTFSGFETLGLWTPAGKRAPFLCIEPWCGSDDYDTDDGNFDHKRGIQKLDPNERKNYFIKIEAK